MSADQLERILAEGTSRALTSRGNWRTGKPSNRLTCEDGFTLSVLAGEGAYCSPRPTDFPEHESESVPPTYEGPYNAVEVGFPSSRPEPWDVWVEYCEDVADPTQTVYGWVPADVVRALITSHGGLK